MIWAWKTQNTALHWWRLSMDTIQCKHYWLLKMVLMSDLSPWSSKTPNHWANYIDTSFLYPLLYIFLICITKTFQLATRELAIKLILYHIPCRHDGTALLGKFKQTSLFEFSAFLRSSQPAVSLYSRAGSRDTFTATYGWNAIMICGTIHACMHCMITYTWSFNNWSCFSISLFSSSFAWAFSFFSVTAFISCGKRYCTWPPLILSENVLALSMHMHTHHSYIYIHLIQNHTQN